MAKTFNCGIGMAVIVPAEKQDEATRIFEEAGETVHYIGTVRESAEDEPATTVIGKPGSWGYDEEWIATSAH